MKKLTSLLIGLSLALAGTTAFAQQPEEQPSPGKKQKKEKTHQTETKAPQKRGGNAENPESPKKQPGGMKEQGAAPTEPGAGKGRKGRAKEKAPIATGAETGASGQTGAAATTEPGVEKGKGRKGRGKVETSAGAGANVSAEPSAIESTGAEQKGGRRGAKGAKKGAGANANVNANASPSVAPTVAGSTSTGAAVTATGQQNAAANVAATGRKADPQKVQQVKQQVQQIKQRHENFRAQPRPDKVPSVTFTANYRIQGSDRWSGPQYEVFRSYHPERHDRTWYHSKYQRVELIGGGYYYWNSGYWYPAWGYDSGHEYYAYDAPIYVGHRAEPPDRVIAEVQAELQEMGFYTGEVDGLLGPLTREAITGYQADQGLEVTAVIDEPTLDSLGMS